jgi:tRNA(adenine34) deaminase
MSNKFMKRAIELSIKSVNSGAGPFGAIIVKDNKLIAKAHNQPIFKNDPTAHAEIQSIKLAGEKLQNYRLTNTILYVTLEPCSMCLSAMMHARIKRLVYGAHDPKTGVCGSCEDLRNAKFFNHNIDIIGGVSVLECSSLMQKFFKSLR